MSRSLFFQSRSAPARAFKRNLSISLSLEEHQLIEEHCARKRIKMRDFLMRYIEPGIVKLRKQRLKRERSVATLATDAGSYSVPGSVTMAAKPKTSTAKSATKTATKAKTPAKPKRAKA